MAPSYEPTTEELKAQWKLSGLWRVGHKFEDDIKVPEIQKCLRNAVICLHRKQQLPQQAALALEV